TPALIGIIWQSPALAAGASVSPNPVAFGTVPVGTTVHVNATVSLDAGFYVAGYTVGDVLGPGAYGADVSGCSGVVGPDTCTVDIGFLPTGPGDSSTTVTLHFCPQLPGTCDGIDISLSGTGEDPRAPQIITFPALPDVTYGAA